MKFIGFTLFLGLILYFVAVGLGVLVTVLPVGVW